MRIEDKEENPYNTRIEHKWPLGAITIASSLHNHVTKTTADPPINRADQETTGDRLWNSSHGGNKEKKKNLVYGRTWNSCNNVISVTCSCELSTSSACCVCVLWGLSQHRAWLTQKNTREHFACDVRVKTPCCYTADYILRNDVLFDFINLRQFFYALNTWLFFSSTWVTKRRLLSYVRSNLGLLSQTRWFSTAQYTLGW